MSGTVQRAAASGASPVNATFAFYCVRGAGWPEQPANAENAPRGATWGVWSGVPGNRYPLAANLPRSAFLKRLSAPLVFISR